MRVVLCLFSLALIALGLWLVAISFPENVPQTGAPTQIVSAPGQTANPVVLGTALLAGGVVFLVLIFRRR